MSKKAIFLDRDGIINVDTSYVYKISQFVFCDGIFKVLKYLKNKNYLLFIITNQSAIGRGYCTLDDFKILNSYMLAKLKDKNINIQEVKYCPHNPQDNCKCRKPNAFMVNELIKKYNIDVANSWFIGDKISDIKCGINAKIKNTILVSSKKYKQEQHSLASFYINTFKKKVIQSIIKN